MSTLAEIFKPRQELVNRLEKSLEGISPERRIFVITSWMEMKQLEELVKCMEEYK